MTSFESNSFSRRGEISLDLPTSDIFQRSLTPFAPVAPVLESSPLMSVREIRTRREERNDGNGVDGKRFGGDEERVGEGE